MSRWSIDGKDNVRQSDALGKKEHIRSGQLASQFTNKTGLDAQLDRDNMIAKEKSNLAKFGPGVTRFALLDGNGAVDPNAVFEADGILFRPNQLGHFYAANEAFLEEELKKEEQIRKYCKKVLKYCVNDETNKILFGLNKPGEYETIFGTGATKTLLSNYGIYVPNDEVAKLDCTATYMESLLPGSSAFHASTQKLIAIIRAFMPMIRGSTKEKEGAKGSLNPFNDKPGRSPEDGNATDPAGAEQRA